MLLLYFYSILGFTNLYNITHNKKISNSIIDIQDYSYSILYDLYSLFIFLLLIFSFTYDIINNTHINIGFILYKLNFISQFIILYFKYHKIIKYKFYDSNNFYNINLYSQIIILFLCVPYIYNYNKYIQTYNYIIFIINFIDIFGLYIYFNSLLLFILVFSKLCQEIYLIRNDIFTYINEDKKGIVEIYYNLINLKYKSSKYISDFNFIFNIFTICNIFSLVFIYKNINFNELYNYTCSISFCIIFILIETIILYIILYISKIRQDIYIEIFSEPIIDNFIKKKNISTFNDKYIIQINSSNYIDNNNLLIQINKTIDWTVLYNTLNMKWMEFDLFGIEIQSFSSISKIIVTSGIIYKLYT